ncbi:M28 family peptidase [Oscillatoriales cyanobacterium LEGE 11467]|uniref:M28 family peptidase n=1 Tax=Zarconia navalis LEGE 11467 TaxID=1828826 RepID=A0A928VV01_9CYAN|nr:M28 family peptidase [Zarconia navalis]MBE9039989.1 M28 family peptidase [Zarconia navalis LEGE 11467]
MKERLHAHLVQLVRERDPYLASAGHFFVREYVRASLAEWGTVASHNFEVQGKIHQNLILDLPAVRDTRKPPILVGAHYDGVPGSPGADDNATGIAVLLEMARAFATEAIAYPIRLVAFDLEEYGLLGSTAYAETLVREGRQLRLMLSLEMLGYCDRTPNSQRYPTPLEYFYPDRGDFIIFVGNLSSLGDLMRLRKPMRRDGTPCEILPVPNAGKWVPDTRRSDHAPFWDRGYRAIMVTDTSFLRNPHYHQKSDRLETLDLDFLTGVCRGAIAGLRCLL